MAGSKGSKNVNSLMTESSHYSLSLFLIYLPINHLSIYYLSMIFPCLSLHCWSQLLDKLSATWWQEGIRQPLLPIFPSEPLHYKETFLPNVHKSIPGKQNETLVSPVWITCPPLNTASMRFARRWFLRLGHTLPLWPGDLERGHNNIFDN